MVPKEPTAPRTTVHLDPFVKWLMALGTLLLGSVLVFWVQADLRRNEARDGREQVAVESIPIIHYQLKTIKELIEERSKSARTDIRNNKSEIDATQEELKVLREIVAAQEKHNTLLETMIKYHAKHGRDPVNP